MLIKYALEPNLEAQEFSEILKASTLAERRPFDDLVRLDKMLRHSDIVVTARLENRLVGLSRAVTDFAYCCYLSDLCVASDFQRQGIGKKLIDETRKAAGSQSSLVLLSAPAAQDYYAKIGMKELKNAWLWPRASDA